MSARVLPSKGEAIRIDGVAYRRCADCDALLRISDENFPVVKGGRSFSKTCRSCLRKRQRELRRRVVKRIPEVSHLNEEDAIWALGLPHGRASIDHRRAWEADAMYEYIAALESPTGCAYCCMPADTVDHVTPIVFVTAILTAGLEPRRPLLKAPACRECNSIAGTRVFDSFGDKFVYVKRRLKQKYEKELKIPKWTEDELNELSGRTKLEVARASRLAEVLRDRMDWVPTMVSVLSLSVGEEKLSAVAGAIIKS